MHDDNELDLVKLARDILLAPFAIHRQQQSQEKKMVALGKVVNGRTEYAVDGEFVEKSKGKQ